MFDKEIITRSLDQAAQKYGDITQLVYDRLFSTQPEAEQLFLLKGKAFKSPLQEKMVQDAIFSFLEFLETPEEVEIEFKYTIPQHLDLGIPIEQFNALLAAVAEVVCSAVPEEACEQTHRSWHCLAEKLSTIATQYASRG